MRGHGRRRTTTARVRPVATRAEERRDDRDAGSSGLRSGEARLLDLQRSVGNAALTTLLSAGGSRAETEDDLEAPDWSAPIEQEADERQEVHGRAEGGRTRVQRHGDQDIGDDRLEGGGTAVQRQAVVAPPTTFPGFASVHGNGDVRQAAWDAWKATLNATTAASRREQGFWVQWDRTSIANANGRYQIVGAVTGTAVGPAAGATINLGTRPADSGNWFTVASFHTHTPTRFRAVGRVVGPSGADHTADTSDNVTGLVYDYTAVRGGAVPARHPLWSPATISRSGPRRRT